jgi:hypothetical protein
MSEARPSSSAVRELEAASGPNDGIEQAFIREGLVGKIPHAFLAVGYGTLEPGGTVRPLSVTISNSFDVARMFSPLHRCQTGSGSA